MLRTLLRTQKLPVTIDKAWDFLSDPANLAVITPPSMGFKTISGDQRHMYPGQVIVYRITPLFGIPISWVTEITHVRDREYFVDEQRFGPYLFWHHQHFLREIPGGVQMEDLLHYKMPLGLIGDGINALLIRKKLREIFEFRGNKLIEIFGPWER